VPIFKKTRKSQYAQTASALLLALENEFKTTSTSSEEYINLVQDNEKLALEREQIILQLKALNDRQVIINNKIDDNDIKNIDLTTFNAIDAVVKVIGNTKTKKKDLPNYCSLLPSLYEADAKQKIEKVKKEANKEKIELTAQLSTKSKSHKKKIPKQNDSKYTGDNLTDKEKYKYQADGNYPPYTFKRDGAFQDYYEYHSNYLRCPYNCVEFPRTTLDKGISHISKCKKNPENASNKKYANNPICPNIEEYYKKDWSRLKQEEKKKVEKEEEKGEQIILEELEKIEAIGEHKILEGDNVCRGGVYRGGATYRGGNISRGSSAARVGYGSAATTNSCVSEFVPIHDGRYILPLRFRIANSDKDNMEIKCAKNLEFAQNINQLQQSTGVMEDTD